jgi:N-acetylneuraminic acid mutarotase
MKFISFLIVFTLLVLFSSENQAQQIEYTNFNSGLNGWITVNGTYSNKWEVGNATGYNNTMGAYISNDGGVNNTYSTNEASVVHLYKDIDFSLATSVTMLTFRWRCKGEEGKDYMSAHLVPTNVTPVAGQELTEGQLSSTEFEGYDYYRGYRFRLTDDLITSTSMRLVFSWRNDNSGGEQHPASVDNIEITNNDFNYGTWSPRLSLPSARYYAASIRNGFGLISLGGLGVNNTPLNEVIEYDMIADRNENLPDLPATFSHNLALKFDGGILSIGGFKNGSIEPTDEVNRLDLSDFSWNSYGLYPKKIFYGKGVVMNWQTLYVIGGSDENDILLRDVNYLERGSNTWKPANPLPTDGVADGGATMLDENRIFYVGGFRPNFDNTLQVDSSYIGTIDPLNPAVITWTRGANFPAGPRARFNAYQWGDGKAIVVGGSNDQGFNSFSDAWIYDADSDSWSKFSAWNQVPNKPTPIAAYQGASMNLSENIWMLAITGGITTGPIWTAVNEMFVDTLEIPLSVEEISGEVPTKFSLAQNYPNPFNPSTTIQFSLPEQSYVKLEIFNTLGEKVDILLSEELSSGTYKYNWNASNLQSGIYYYSLTADNFRQTKKLILLK